MCGTPLLIDIESPPLHWHAAKFILSIKERHSLSQSAINCVTSSTVSLMMNVNQGILNEMTMDPEVPDHVVRLLHNKFGAIESSLFSRLSTAYQQRTYFKDTFLKIVRSIHVCMSPACGNHYNV